MYGIVISANGLSLFCVLICMYFLIFAATVPPWVEDTARRYMGDDRVLVDLIGQETVRTAVTVEHKAICCPYQERPTVINDVIQVSTVCYC